MARSMYKAALSSGRRRSGLIEGYGNIEDLETERKYEKEKAALEEQSLQDTLAGITEGVSLIDKVVSGRFRQKEAAADITKAFPGAEQTYGESKWGDIFRSAKGTEGRRGEGETRWGELGEKISVLFGGKERKWEVPEYSALQGAEGVSAGEYKQSDLLAKAKQSTWDELGMGDRGGCPDGQYKDPITQQCVDFAPQTGP